MFTVTLNGANRVDVDMDGKLDSTAMQAALDKMVEKPSLSRAESCCTV